MKTPRRSTLKQILISIAGMAGFSSSVQAEPMPGNSPVGAAEQPDIPLYSSSKKLGNLLFIMGIGAHFDGDIKSHTEHVLTELEKELVKAGSSMEKVLKVSVMLHDLNDYKVMNEVYKGQFGAKPPVRTTVAVYGGVPNGSLVEIDCIAHV